MSAQGFLIILIISGAAGIVAEITVGFGAGSFLVATGVGFVGASLGSWLARAVGLPAIYEMNVEGQVIDLGWTVIGAILLLVIVERVIRFLKESR